MTEGTLYWLLPTSSLRIPKDAQTKVKEGLESGNINTASRYMSQATASQLYSSHIHKPHGQDFKGLIRLRLPMVHKTKLQRSNI